jgi:hypothetical protein
MPPDKNQNINCIDCYAMLTEIKTLLGSLRGDLMKIIFVLLGLEAGKIGVKYLGTPWHLYIMVYVCLGVSAFLFASTIYAWAKKKIEWLWGVLGIILTIHFGYESILRIVFYSQGSRIPRHYGIYAQLISVAAAIIVFIIFFRNGRWDGKERRKTPNPTTPEMEG